MWEGTEKPQQQAPPQQHCCKSSNSDTGRDPPCLLAQDVGHLCLSLGSGDIQAQFGDSSPTLHTNARLSLVLVSSASLEGRKCMADSTWGGGSTHRANEHWHRIQQKQKGKFLFIQTVQTISYNNFSAFVKISFQTGKDSGRVP